MTWHTLPSCGRYSVLLAALLALAPAARAEEPLHRRIDGLIAAGMPDFARRAAGPSTDAEFFRRVHLDLVGSIPTAQQARAFLADPSPGKRQALVDQLLASPEHARHLATVFDVMLLQRRSGRNVPEAEWREYLRTSFTENKPWDQLVREILSADGIDPKTRAASTFYLVRDGEPNLLTRDVGRLFLGLDLECAQCHDHPLVPDYKQDHYYGLFAFVSRSQVVADKKLKRTVLGEKADGEVTFQSVFDPKKVTKKTGPRVPFGPALDEPAIEKGKEYAVKPEKDVAGVPTHSRRALLAPNLARADYAPFSRTIANRLWALLMGRGLIDPVDMDHAGNPPSHPELLDLLAGEMVEHEFDVRAFLRELALSETYQRSSALPADGEEIEPDRFAVAQLKPLSPEQLAWSLMQATGLTDVQRAALGKKLNEATLYASLSRNVTPFVRAFAAPAGEPQEFDARLDQALFLRNGDTVRSWLAPKSGNLVDRLGRLTKPEEVAEELYLSVLTRPPEEDERREVADFLAAHGKDRTRALQDLAWALLASAEFRFNH